MSLAVAETVEQIKARNKDLIDEVLRSIRTRPRNGAPSISVRSRMARPIAA